MRILWPWNVDGLKNSSAEALSRLCAASVSFDQQSCMLHAVAYLQGSDPLPKSGIHL